MALGVWGFRVEGFEGLGRTLAFEGLGFRVEVLQEPWLLKGSLESSSQGFGFRAYSRSQKVGTSLASCPYSKV